MNYANITKSRTAGQYIGKGAQYTWRIWKEKVGRCTWRAQAYDGGVPLKQFISAHTLGFISKLIAEPNH